MREKVWFFLHICQSHPLGPGNGGSVGVIAGVGGGVAALLLGVVLYIMFYRRRKAKKAAVLPFSEDSTLHGNDTLGFSLCKLPCKKLFFLHLL